jgi:hypothetical protein
LRSDAFISDGGNNNLSSMDWVTGGKVRYGSRRNVITAILFVGLMSTTSLLAQSQHVIIINGTHEPELSMAVAGRQASHLLPVSVIVAAEELPDAPSANDQEPSNTSGAPYPAVKTSKRSWQGAPPAARGGPFGIDGRVVDRNYWLWTGGMFAASTANVEATHDCLVARTCAWVPSAFTRRRNMLMAGFSADLGVAYLSYYMKKKHSSLWFVPEALVTAVNTYICIHDARRAME